MVDDQSNDPAALKPTAQLVDPAVGSIDSSVINDPGRKHEGKTYLDISFSPASGQQLDYDSILDPGTEFTLARDDGTTVSHNGVPVPIVTTVSQSRCIHATRSYGKGCNRQSSSGAGCTYRYTCDHHLIHWVWLTV